LIKAEAMTTPRIKVTSQEFWNFINLPENANRFFERINGEIVEYMASNPYCSETAINIATFFKIYLFQNDIGRVTGEGGGYDVSEDDTFAPDVAFILYERQENLPYRGFATTYPDIAVEVLSPSDLADPKRRIQEKLDKYIAIPIPLLWMVYPERKEVEIYEMGVKTRVATENDVLDGGKILPGFQVKVADIFPKQR
jgi:Uma2 family endonuclease